MADGYRIVDSDFGYGREMIIDGEWKPEYKEAMRQENAIGLRLGHTSFVGDDLNFLAELPELKILLIDIWSIRDLAIVETLTELRELTIVCDVRKSVDLTKLPKLEVFMGAWKKQLNSVFSCTGIKHLNLTRYPGTDLSLLENMKGLEKLYIVSRKLTSLKGIEMLAELELLDMYACTQLTSFDGIESLDGLSQVEIQSCKKFTDITPLSKLPSLTDLKLIDCGKIETLSPFAGSESIESLTVTGATNVVDGDFAFVTTMPCLQEIMITERRHYSHKYDELRQQIGQPPVDMSWLDR